MWKDLSEVLKSSVEERLVWSYLRIHGIFFPRVRGHGKIGMR